jgi:chemotaxis protein MotB
MNLEGMDEQPGWIVTYADLVTLLLVFFVMLFSISSLDIQRYRALAAALQKSFGNPTSMIELVSPDIDKKSEDFTHEPPDVEIPVELIEKLKEVLRSEMNDDLRDEIREEVWEEVQKELLDEQQLMKDVEELLEKKKMGDYIVVYKEQNRITIVVEGQVFFASGEATLQPDALPILDDIAAIIRKYPNYRVNIKGHTDDRPINTVQFPSNWELSAVRATTVLRYLITQNVDPLRLTATGYGELLPIAPNDTPENRARNRRVEFVLEKERKEIQETDAE